MAKHQKEHEGRGDAFTAITREQFDAKLKPVNSPMIVSHGWNPSAPPGGTISYRGLVVNYDVRTYTNLALVVFVGNCSLENISFSTSARVWTAHALSSMCYSPLLQE